MPDKKSATADPNQRVTSNSSAPGLRELRGTPDRDPADVPLETAAQTATTSDSKYINKVRSNVKSDLIEITDDKLENILLKYVALLTIRTAWITPLSIFLAVLIATLTATFSDTFGIKASVWEAMFILLAVVSFVWLVVDLVLLCVRWKDSSMDRLLGRIKNAQ